MPLHPVEQLLGALGNCLAVGYAANASAAGVELNKLRIELEGDLDLHTFLGLADGHLGLSDGHAGSPPGENRLAPGQSNPR